MNKRRSILVIVALLALLALVLTTGGALAQADPSGVTVPYTSQLTDDTGQPLNGVYAFTFALYDAETGGHVLWSETQAEVAVKNGDFAIVLGEMQAIPQDVAERKELWLAVSVRGPQETTFTLLNPRQHFNAPASPSALTCPHNHFTDSWPGSNSEYGLLLENTSTGDGLRAYSKSTVWNYAAVFGANIASTGYGTGVYGYSAKGAGVYANSAGGDALEATTAANSKSAVYAHTDATGANGVWAVSGTGRGVYGYSASRDAIEGLGHSVDRSGVYGRSDNGGWGVSGYTSSTLTTRAAVSGYNQGSGYGVLGNTRLGTGVYGISENDRGVVGVDGGPLSDNSFAVWADGDIQGTDDLSIQDDLTVLGFSTFSGGKSGFVVDIAQNDDTVDLTTGDLVIISGAGPAVVGEIPVIKVRRATDADAGAIVGVVDLHYVPASRNTKSYPNGETKSESISDDHPIAPGEYLTVVTLGSFKAIKVDAAHGSIKPGDLLVASSNPGYAMKSVSSQPGTIIGKALGELKSGTGAIPLIVTLQ